MIPSINFNPSFSNLSALHGLGGIPHPIRLGKEFGFGGPAPMPGPVEMPPPISPPSYPGTPPSFANLAALHGFGGGIPHPIRPIIGDPMLGSSPIGATTNGDLPVESPISAQSYPTAPAQPGMPMSPYGNLSNLHALMQLLRQR